MARRGLWLLVLAAAVFSAAAAGLVEALTKESSSGVENLNEKDVKLSQKDRQIAELTTKLQAQHPPMRMLQSARRSEASNEISTTTFPSHTHSCSRRSCCTAQKALTQCAILGERAGSVVDNSTPSPTPSPTANNQTCALFDSGLQDDFAKVNLTCPPGYSRKSDPGAIACLGTDSVGNTKCGSSNDLDNCCNKTDPNWSDPHRDDSWNRNSGCHPTAFYCEANSDPHTYPDSCPHDSIGQASQCQATACEKTGDFLVVTQSNPIPATFSAVPGAEGGNTR